VLYHSQKEINAFYEFVIRKVAERKNIQDIDFKSAFEIQTTIEQVDTETYEKQGDFLHAYQAWYNVHDEINVAGTSGNLTAQQTRIYKQLSKSETTRGQH